MRGLHKIHQLVAAAASAPGAFSCGTGDRMDNERKSQEKALQILEMI